MKITFDLDTAEGKKEFEEFIKINLLTKNSASTITGQTHNAFAQSVKYGIIKPIFESTGKGPAKVKLYFKKDVEEYAERLKKRTLRSKK